MDTDEREGYLLLARSQRFAHKVEQTEKIIRAAIQDHPEPWILAFSGGKDSTVLADLLGKCGWKGDGVFFYYSKYESPQENLYQVQWARDTYGYNIQQRKRYGDYDAWVELGRFFCTPETEDEKRCARRIAQDRKEVSASFMRDVGAKNIFMGLCKDESRARKISLSMRGHTYFVDSRDGWTCCPLANWSGQDIWAYIVSRSLPYLSVYDLPHWSRERIRNELTVLSCSDLVLRGEMTQYRRAYPELFAELAAEFPEVRQYV